MNKKLKLTGVIAASFAAGFVIHALFFPYVFTESDLDKKAADIQYLKEDYEKKQDDTVQDKSITYVNFDNSGFHPAKVEVGKGYYLAVTNRTNDRTMWLESETPYLRTVRGYALSERLFVRMDTAGTFIIINKGHSSEKLTVVVK